MSELAMLGQIAMATRSVHKNNASAGSCDYLFFALFISFISVDDFNSVAFILAGKMPPNETQLMVRLSAFCQ